VIQTLKCHKKPLIRCRFLKHNHIVSCSFDAQVCWWTPDGELAGSNDTRQDFRADGFACTETSAFVGDYRANIAHWNRKTPAKPSTWKVNETKRQIESLTVDPKGKWLLSGGADGILRVWDVAKARLITQVEFGLGNYIYSLDWRTDSKLVAAAIAPDGSAPKGATSRIVLLNPKTWKETQSLSPEGCQPYACAFSHDGALLAAAGGGTDRGGNESKKNCGIRIWDLKSGELRHTLVGHSGLVRDLAFAPDSNWLLSAGWDDTVRNWNLETDA